MATKRYAVSAVWPAVAGLWAEEQVGGNLIGLQVWNETVPPLSVWTANTHNGIALGATYHTLRFQFNGSLAAGTTSTCLQGDTVTVVLGTGILSVTLGSENSSYQITCTITNTTSGEYLTLDCTTKLGQMLTIDCAAKTVTLDDGTNVFNALTISPGRTNTDWLNIGVDTNGKFTAATVITITETGIAKETWNISWADASY
jgi:hypothetical protein